MTSPYLVDDVLVFRLQPLLKIIAEVRGGQPITGCRWVFLGPELIIVLNRFVMQFIIGDAISPLRGRRRIYLADLLFYLSSPIGIVLFPNAMRA